MEKTNTEAPSLKVGLLGLPITGLLGLFVSKIVDRWGVLDGPANTIGDFLKSNVSGADLANLLGLIVFLALYILLMWKFGRVQVIYRDRHHEQAAGQLAVSDNAEAEVVRATSVKSARDQHGARLSDIGGGFRRGLQQGLSGAGIETGLLPDMRLSDVVRRLKERLGDDRQRIHEAIVDAAYHKQVQVWGRMVADKPAKLVWIDAWENGVFSLDDGTVVYRSPDNPHAQFKWTGLMFNKDQVDRWMPPDLGPNGWMAR